MITLAPGTVITGVGDLSLNNTMGAQLVANTIGNNYVVCNNTFAPNISGGFSISLWFSCSGQLNKTGTLISLPYNKTGNGLEIDISGTNMIYSGWNFNILNSAYVYLPLTTNTTNYGTGGNGIITVSNVTTAFTYTTNLGKSCIYINNQGSTFNTVDTAALGNFIYINNFLSDNTTSYTFGGWYSTFNSKYFDVAGVCTTGNTLVLNVDINSSGYNIFYYMDPTVVQNTTGLSNTTTNWTHFACVCNPNGTSYLYINGTLSGSGTATTTSNQSNYIIIGGGSNLLYTQQSGGMRGFNGYIRHFFAFKSILTATQVLSIYNSTS
jgi:hypothetical protein